MKALKINQTLGVLMIVGAFAYIVYTTNSTQTQYSAMFGSGLLLAGFLWYGIARFLIWMKKD